MALGDFLAKLGGGAPSTPPEPEAAAPSAAPGRDDLASALARVEGMVAAEAVPSCVTARVERVTHVVRDTIPRLGQIRGSASAYSVMATATDYLPEALGGYLRLPRRFADTRPVDGGRTSLMVLVDQLDLLGATMDQVFDAVCRDDATALVAHGRFLEDKFGHASTGGELDVGRAYAVPAMPTTPRPPEPSAGPEPSPASDATASPGSPTPATDQPDTEEPTADQHAHPVGRDSRGPAPALAPESPAPEPSAPRPNSLDLDSPAPDGSDDGSGAGGDEPPRLSPPTWP